MAPQFWLKINFKRLEKGAGILAPPNIWSLEDSLPIHDICSVLRRFMVCCRVLQGGVDFYDNGLADKPDVVHEVGGAHSPGCEGRLTAIMDFTNKIGIDNNVTSRMKSLFALLARHFLTGCGNGEQMLKMGRGFNVRINAGGSRNKRQSRRRRMYVDGMDPRPRTVSCQTGRASYTLNNPAPNCTMCHVAHGMMMLYL